MRQQGAVLPLKADAATNTVNDFPALPPPPPGAAGAGGGNAYALARAVLEAAGAERSAAGSGEHGGAVACEATRVSAGPRAAERCGAGDARTGAPPKADTAAAAPRQRLAESSSDDDSSGDEAPPCAARAPAVAAPAAPGAAGVDVPRALQLPPSDDSSSDEDEAALEALCRKYVPAAK